MKSTGRTHRFTPSLWIGRLLAGGSLTLLAVATVVANYGDLIAGNVSFMGYAGLFLVVPYLFSIGVYLLAMPIVTRIVTSPQGLEYHTLTYIIQVDWQEIGQLSKGEITCHRTCAIEPQAIQLPNIQPRRWTRFVRLDVQKRAIKQGIPLYKFGGYRGRWLMADIRTYAPHLDI
jgi:hypothetical protein